MNIIKTDIVADTYDMLWQDIPAGDMPARPLLVVVSDCEANSAEDQQLSKMLAASKLIPAQYNILRLPAGQQVAWHKLRDQLEPRVVFLLGVTPGQLGVSALLSFNRPNNFDGRLWLATASLQELAKNDELKKQLWNNGMKPLFIDKLHGEF